MIMQFPVDSYSVRAQYAPGLIVALPVLVTLWTCFQPEMETISTLTGSVISGAVFYFLSVVARSNGKRIEPGLWKSWGGPPSTTFLSWNDSRLGPDLKAKYHEAVRRYFGLPMPSQEEEQASSDRASRLIEQAFVRVKTLIREKDKRGLWVTANAEYGFARNLYGSRWMWLIISFLMSAIPILFLWRAFDALILVGIIINVLSLTACVGFGFIVLPSYSRQVGNRYAEHAWESFLMIAEGAANAE